MKTSSVRHIHVPTPGRTFLLYRAEVSKALRLRQTYIGPLLLTAMVLLSPLAHPLAKDELSDYAFIAYVTPLFLNFLGYVLLLAYVAGLISSELGRGTLRAVLLRPVLREEVYLAKLLIGFSYSTVLSLTVAATSWAITLALGDLHGIQVGGELLYTSDDMLKAYCLGGLLTLAPQWAGVSLALLFSSLTRNTGTAISLSLGVWIVIDLLKYPLGIAPFIFTTYLDAPWHVFAAYCDGLDASWFPMVFYCLITSLGVSLLSTGLGLVLFSRRNMAVC